MRKAILNFCRMAFICSCVCLLATTVDAQPPVKKYTVRNGKMYIELGRLLSEQAVDSFIAQFELYDIALKDFFNGKLMDSIKRAGWELERNDNAMFVISKPLKGFGRDDKIIMSPIPDDKGVFPAVSSKVVFGYNRFRRSTSLTETDSSITFFLPGNQRASNVILSGSFNDWSPTALLMTKTDSGWIRTVKLQPGKYWYKFIIDGHWKTDGENLQVENDGRGNMNSVVFKSNHVFKLKGYESARRVYVTGSFNTWKEKELLMIRAGDGWQLPVYLANGTHTYRFIADGKWLSDEANPDRLPNEFNDYNSVVRLGKPFLFRLDGYEEAKSVVLSGSFNKWRKDELFLTKINNGWELLYNLGPGNYEYNFIIDNKRVATNPDGKGNLFFIIEPNYTFRLKGFPDARNVYLAGTFNDWSPNTFAMRKEGDEWVIAVHLSPGKQLYKFVVDGKWIIDPWNKLWEQNEHNSGNSVLWVTDVQVQ